MNFEKFYEKSRSANANMSLDEFIEKLKEANGSPGRNTSVTSGVAPLGCQSMNNINLFKLLGMNTFPAGNAVTSCRTSSLPLI